MNLNKCLFGGRFTRDHELRYTPKGTAVLNNSLAINERKPDGKGGWEEAATFVEVKAWGQTAEAISNYTIKGSPVFVECRCTVERWEDKASGQQRSKVVFVIEQCQFLERADAQSRRAEGQHQGGGQQPRQGASQGQQQPAGGGGQPHPAGGYHDPDDDDDIPF